METRDGQGKVLIALLLAGSLAQAEPQTNPASGSPSTVEKKQTELEKNFNGSNAKKNRQPIIIVEPWHPKVAVKAEGTIILKETYLGQERIEEPKLGQCDTSETGHTMCGASCTVTIRQKYQRTYKIVDREVFVDHVVSKASRRKDIYDVVVAFTSLGIGSFVENLRNPDNTLERLRQKTQEMPEVFTKIDYEESRERQRFPGVIDPKYFKQLTSDICE